MPRKSRSRKSSKRGKKVSFVTADGRRVSFTPKPKKKKATPAHLKPYTKRMKELSKAYQKGDFGNMSWNSVVSEYMSKPIKHSSRKRSSKRRRSNKRRR